MSALGRFIVRRRAAAIDEYQAAAHGLAVAQHSPEGALVRRSRATERVARAQRRLYRWEFLTAYVEIARVRGGEFPAPRSDDDSVVTPLNGSRYADELPCSRVRR